MLSVKRCPHTGVVNYYSESDPHLAVGSIARCGTSAVGFTWRCHAGGAERSGRAPDLESAQQRLTSFLVVAEGSAAGLLRPRFVG
jgi:hypothetical protein